MVLLCRKPGLDFVEVYHQPFSLGIMVTPGGTEGDGGVSQGGVTPIRADTPCALSGGGLDLGTFIKYPSVTVKEGGPRILADYQKRKSLSAKEEMPGFEEIPLDPIPWGNQILEEKEVGDDMMLSGGPTWGLQGFQDAQKISCELRE